MAAIGFVGLGNMGGPMAANLIKAGHKLRVFDLSQPAIAKLVEAGAEAAPSATDAAKGADAVITMLPAGANVRDIYLGPQGLIASAPRRLPPRRLLDHRCGDGPRGQRGGGSGGLDMLDAPVSGGVGGAQAATLTFMAGGSESAFKRAEPILSCMGKAVIYAGGPGNGQAAKICNNMILGISMIAVSEAFTLGEKLGLSHQTLFDIASKSSGQCWSLTSYCPVPGPVPTSPANRNYSAGFTAGMMLKDLKLAQDASRMTGANTPLGAEAASLYGLFASQGAGGLDFSAIIQFLRGNC